MDQRGVRGTSGWADRIGGVAGVAFVGLFMASFYFGESGFSGYDQTADAIAANLATGRIEDGLGTSVALVGLAAIAGFWFVASLHQRLANRGTSAAVWAALVGGVASVGAVLAISAVTGAAVIVDSLARDPQVAKTLWLLEHSIFDHLLGPTLTVFTLAVSVVSLTRGDPPRWVGWSGLAVTAGLTANTALRLGSLALLGILWVLALAITITVRPQPQHSMQRVPTT